jgi:hypothetical protein
MVVGLRLPNSHPQQGDALVHTLDISSSGAKIGALREYIQPGSVLTVRRGHLRTQCRVTWTRQIAPEEVQIGIELLDRGARFWGFDLDDDCAGVWLSESQR